VLATLLRVHHATVRSSNSILVPSLLQEALEINDHTFDLAVIT
jgi:hypothetical protein